MQTPEAKAIYRKRGQTVELRFADAKAHRGLRRFSGRGLERVRIEVGHCVRRKSLGCPGRRPAKSRRWTKWNVLPGRSLKAGRSLKGGAFPAELPGVRIPDQRSPVMRPSYNGPSQTITDLAVLWSASRRVLVAVWKPELPRECLQPHGPILPGSARFAISVSLFQHHGAAVHPHG